MENLYSTLIALFGTISAITVAYLILLYEQANKRRLQANNNILIEVNSSLHCGAVLPKTSLDQDSELVERLKDDHRHKNVNIDDVNSLQAELETTISNLRRRDVDSATPDEASDRLKAALHIEKYHFNDTRHALDEYTKSEDFYDEFPFRSKCSVGIPLIICGYFILAEIFLKDVTNDKWKTFFFWFDLLVAIGGLAFVYWITTSTLSKLKGD